MTLYQSLKAAGVALDSHESDLYCEDTLQAREILKRFPLTAGHATPFTNQRPPNVGQRWLDIPFAFDPWWEKRQKFSPVTETAPTTAKVTR